MEYTCPRCSYRTTLAVERCPTCAIPLVAQTRARTASRRSRRLPLRPSLRATLDEFLEAAVLEVSAAGARLEHRKALRPGQRHLLTLTSAGPAAPLQVRARVVWSWVHRFEPGRDQAGFVYHSGVAFEALPGEIERELAVYLLGGFSSGGPHQGTPQAPPY